MSTEEHLLSSCHPKQKNNARLIPASSSTVSCSGCSLYCFSSSCFLVRANCKETTRKYSQRVTTKTVRWYDFSIFIHRSEQTRLNKTGSDVVNFITVLYRYMCTVQPCLFSVFYATILVSESHKCN